MNILKNTMLGLFFGTFGTTIRWNYWIEIWGYIKESVKFYFIICIRTHDVNSMF